MLNDIQKEWVAALRSGQYKQGKGLLRDKNDNFCCLGVLCEILAQKGKIPSAELKLSFESDIYAYDGRWKFLPNSVEVLTRVGETNELMRMNDSGESFDKIADYIESEPEGLFV
jgi:hypothetical protein